MMINNKFLIIQKYVVPIVIAYALLFVTGIEWIAHNFNDLLWGIITFLIIFAYGTVMAYKKENKLVTKEVFLSFVLAITSIVIANLLLILTMILSGGP